jgi:hypothetical protein
MHLVNKGVEDTYLVPAFCEFPADLLSDEARPTGYEIPGQWRFSCINGNNQNPADVWTQRP